MGDVNKAALAASALSGDTSGKKVRIRTSHLEKIIPHGASLTVEPMVFHKLKPGDVICVRVDSDVVVRRYVKYVMEGPVAILLVTHDSARLLEEVKHTQLLGKVGAVEFRGKNYDPRADISGLKGVVARMTDFGTSNPVQKLRDSTGEFFRVFRRRR